MTQDKRSFGVAVVEGIMWLLSRLPLRFHLWWAKFFTWILKITQYRRDVVMINLARSFPEKRYKELKKIADRFYKYFGCLVAEALWFGGRIGAKGRKELNESGIVNIVNPEVFNEVYDKSTNVMVLQAHHGNWELLGGWFSYNHNPEVPLHSDFSEIGVVYKKPKKELWNRVFADNRCNSIKDTGFDGYLESQEVLRFAITHRKQKFIYIFPTDQYPYKIAAKHNIGKFLNQDTLAMTGATALACKLGMSVNYLRWKCLEPGKYSVEFVPICENATGYTPEELLEKYYKLLEQDIIEQPWSYLWTHRRWK